MAMVHEDEIMGKAYDSKLMRRLLVFLQPYRKQMFLALMLIFATSAADLAGPFLLKEAIDNHITPRHADTLWTIFALYVVAVVAGFALRYAQNYLMQFVGQRVMYDLRVKIFSHLQHQSLAYFDRNPVGRLITRLTNDVDALNELLSSGVVTIAGDLVILVGIIIVMFSLNWQLALVGLSVLPVIYLVTQRFQSWMRNTYRQQRVRLAKVNAFLAENVSGMLVVQLFNREKTKYGEFNALNSELLGANLNGLKAFSLFFPAVNILATVSAALLIWYGSGEVLSGVLTLGVLVAFLQYMDRAFQPIRDLAEKYNIMQSAMAAAERMFMLLDEEPTVLDTDKPQQLEKVKGDVEFDNVTFYYNPDETVLKNVSFKIPAGSSVAIVGATGAGKSSIISLLNRFYDVQGGEIKIDGVNVRDVPQGQLRQHIGLVLQDPVLFSGTIASNIRLLNDKITDEQVRAAAKFVNADSFIQKLPGGYDYEVNERGTNLSVGQRQLLAFARAIAFNPSVMLVMDEATSSVDTETEALIQDALVRMLNNRTSIIIAHRLSTIRDVNRIIVLHKGRVVEEGTHDELMARGDYYHRLYQLQYQEQERQLAADGLRMAEGARL